MVVLKLMDKLCKWMLEPRDQWSDVFVSQFRQIMLLFYSDHASLWLRSAEVWNIHQAYVSLRLTSSISIPRHVTDLRQFIKKITGYYLKENLLRENCWTKWICHGGTCNVLNKNWIPLPFVSFVIFVWKQNF